MAGKGQELLSSDQIATYNRTLRHLMVAFQTLQEIKGQGWTQHVLLKEVSDELWYAWQSGMELSYLNTSGEIRRAYWAEGGGE